MFHEGIRRAEKTSTNLTQGKKAKGAEYRTKEVALFEATTWIEIDGELTKIQFYEFMSLKHKLIRVSCEVDFEFLRYNVDS